MEITRNQRETARGPGDWFTRDGVTEGLALCRRHGGPIEVRV